MPLRISLQTTSALVASTVSVVADAIHTRYLRHQAINTLRTNNLTIHVFHSQDCHPNGFYRHQAYPMAGHYFEAGHRPRSVAQEYQIKICKFKTMYETPTEPVAEIRTTNRQVTWHETATWPHFLNQVEVQFADEQVKPVVDYLEKEMKRETYSQRCSRAIELSELARQP